jgi:hypothetical protein
VIGGAENQKPKRVLLVIGVTVACSIYKKKWAQKYRVASGTTPDRHTTLLRPKKILTEKNLAGYRRAQQDEGQIRRGDVS